MLVDFRICEHILLERQFFGTIRVSADSNQNHRFTRSRVVSICRFFHNCFIFNNTQCINKIQWATIFIAKIPTVVIRTMTGQDPLAQFSAFLNAHICCFLIILKLSRQNVP